MKCHMCPQIFFIRTDPKNSDYVIEKGAKRKTETWDPKDSETVSFEHDDEKKRLEEDPFYKLEHENADKIRAREVKPQLLQLQHLQTSRQDHFSLNRALRQSHRKRKREEKALESEAREKGLAIPLLRASPSDAVLASQITFKSNGALREAKRRKLLVRSSRIFPSKNTLHKSNPGNPTAYQALLLKQSKLQASRKQHK
eukprot:TRINITY_DN22044_c0_g1_i1.p1 TRINITY_DN22044_c0_g1~~TRINITY_DN22044_c0_g1_i1.p1  ORF type:complete len:199 (+),score=50.35 TRINITY_DN22044_c0_g1_i1:327-923(+)